MTLILLASLIQALAAHAGEPALEPTYSSLKFHLIERSGCLQCHAVGNEMDLPELETYRGLKIASSLVSNAVDPTSAHGPLMPPKDSGNAPVSLEVYRALEKWRLVGFPE